MAVINEELGIKNVKKKEVCRKLAEQGFTPMRKITKIESTKLKSFKDEKKEGDEEDEEEEDEQQSYFFQNKIYLFIFFLKNFIICKYLGAQFSFF